MRLYADRPARLVHQVLGDLLVVLLVYAAVRLGLATRDRIADLAAPGREAERQARALDGKLRGAAGRIDDAPLVGGTVARPFRDLAATSRDLATTARGYQDTVEQVALLAGLAVAVLPVLLLLALWLPRRVGWVLAATAAGRLASSGPQAADLLALRALTRASLRDLARLSPEVAAGWRAGDPGVIDALAALELEQLGLRMPARTASPRPVPSGGLDVARPGETR